MEKNDIILIHGTNYKVMAKKVMEAANVAEDIGDKKKKIALKPNLVTAKAPSSGATRTIIVVHERFVTQAWCKVN